MPIDLIPIENTDRIDFIKNQVLQKLGYPVINIEITQEQLIYQMTEAMMVYQKEILYMEHGIYTYDPEDIHTEPYQVKLVDHKNRRIIGVKEVIGQEEEFVKFQNVYRQYLMRRTGMKDLLQVMSYYDIQRKILRPEQDWRFDQHDSKIIFYTKFPEKCRFVVFYFVMPLIEDIKQVDIEWIIDYTTQLCKEILGRIRSKISSINTTVGQITLDGQQLVSEQQQEKQQLVERIRDVHSWHIDPISVF